MDSGRRTRESHGGRLLFLTVRSAVARGFVGAAAISPWFAVVSCFLAARPTGSSLFGCPCCGWSLGELPRARAPAGASRFPF
jgi:hypothetical protein